MGKDLISRKDAIDALSTPHGILYPIRTIEDLPSVRPERKESDWNLCSDRPPEKEGRYLITVDEGDRKDVRDDFFYFREDGVPSWYVEKNVIAWMPLPEPYGGEQE